MSRPLLLDLFCGAGGAAMGYHRAGFDVVGVDMVEQPNYPFMFLLGDAMQMDGAMFAAVHASPVCLRYANVTAWRGDPNSHPDQLQPMIDKLSAGSVPWVVENVPEALATWDVLLCGSNFGIPVKRHRGFRFGRWYPDELLNPCDHRELLPFMHKGERAYADAMDCEWMTNREARQAIPPAYTEWIGRQLIKHLHDLPPARANRICNSA